MMCPESEHSDAAFYERYDFCRSDCAECDRLDREAMDGGKTRFELNIEGLDNVLRALRDGWGNRWGPLDEVP
jgi:hypothetical protein